jgi:prepilin-type N-terminal cleavage/methylation domain-containing protein
MRPISKRGGFTLLEIMIAMAICAVVLVVTYGAFSAVTDNVARAEKAAQAYQTARIVMDRMCLDLSNAYVKEYVPEDESPYSFIYKPAAQEGLWETFTLSSTAHMPLNARTFGLDMCRVSYELQKEENADTYSLYRKDEPLFMNNREADVPAMMIGSGFLSFELTFFDAEDQPLPDWDSTKGKQHNKLPKRVVVSFVIKGEDGAEYPFSSGWSLGLTS